MMKCDDLAIIEQLIGGAVANSVSPGFTYGRSGNVPAESWYINNEVVSNITGIPFGLQAGKILAVWAGSQLTATYDIEIYEHEGNEVNLTLLATINIVALTSAIIIPTDTEFNQSADPSQFKQIGCKLVNGSAKFPKVSIFLGGTP